jgi:hypothetical protein
MGFAKGAEQRGGTDQHALMLSGKDFGQSFRGRIGSARQRHRCSQATDARRQRQEQAHGQPSL